MPRRIFAAGSVTNTTGAPLRLEFYPTSTSIRREADLWTIDGSNNLVERITNGIIVTNASGAYSAFAGPDDIDVLYALPSNTTSRTTLTASNTVTGGTTVDTATFAKRSNNLSDLTSASSARASLGLGSVAVLSTAATAAAVAVDSSLTGAYTPLNAAIEGVTLYAYGHSYLAGQAGAARRHYATRLTSRLNLTLTNRAVGGARSIDTVETMYAGASAWTVGTKGIVLMECLINDSRLHGNDSVAKTGSLNALRSMLALLNASARTELDAASGSISYSGTWTQNQVNTTFSAGKISFTTEQNAYADVVTPAGDAYIIMAGKNNTAGSGPTVSVTDQTASGATLATLDLSAQTTPTTDTPTYVPYAYRVPTAARGHTLRFTKTDAAASSLTLDVMLPQTSTPPCVVLVKEPYLADYSLSVSFPNGSDAATDAFNVLLDTAASEFTNCVVVNPGAYWDKTTCIYSGDGVHPNDKGADALARAVMATLQSLTASLLTNAGVGNVS